MLLETEAELFVAVLFLALNTVPLQQNTEREQGNHLVFHQYGGFRLTRLGSQDLIPYPVWCQAGHLKDSGFPPRDKFASCPLNSFSGRTSLAKLLWAGVACLIPLVELECLFPVFWNPVDGISPVSKKAQENLALRFLGC